MGHRALIAYERDDGQYNVHYTHWGAHALELKGKITEETPLGGENTDPEFVNALLSALDGADMDVDGALTEPQDDTAVEPDPVATGVDIETVTHEMLDFLHHEAFYVVDREFTVDAFHTARFGDVTEESVGEGVLVDPGWRDGEPRSLQYMRGVIRGYREAAEDMIEGDQVDADRRAIKKWLVDRIRTLAAERASGEHIPEYSPYGYPARNCRKGGYATSAVEIVTVIDLPDA